MSDHSTPVKWATQKNRTKEYRDPKLCVCKSYLHEPHHHCAECGFAIQSSETYCGECLCE